MNRDGLSQYQRTRAEVWRKEAAPEDTAPPAPSPTASLEEWGVTFDEARDLLRRQMCPVCGSGPWKSPLNHVAKKHGIDRRTMRDVCGVTTVESVVEPELSKRISDRTKTLDMAKVARSGPRARTFRMTTAGRAAVSGNLRQWEEQAGEEVVQRRRQAATEASKTSEAKARQAEALRRRWDALTPEQRRAASTHLTDALTSDEQRRRVLAGWEGRRQPCGTRAAYRRGCRCEECRAAYLAYRKEHG